MNKIIKQELEKVKSVELNYDDNTTSIYIPKTIEIKPTALEVGCVYQVELDDSVVHPSSTSTLSSNWNQGRVPKNYVYTAEVVQILGDFIKLNGIADNDPTDNWYGFIPKDQIKVIEKR